MSTEAGPSVSNGATHANGSGITEDEAALYDRQIRLWGVEAQNKMRTSSVLISTLRGVAAEITKNIVLAGVGSITLLDSENVKADDLGANFFLREEDVGTKRVEAAAPRIQNLNPRVSVKTETDSARLQDETFLSQFDIIVLTEVEAAQLSKTNDLTRKLGKKMFAASSVGMDGWVWADLLDHEYMIDKITIAAGELPVKVPTKVSTSYVPFSAAIEHKFAKLSARQRRKTSPMLWGVLSSMKAQLEHPGQAVTKDSLSATAASYLQSISIDTKVLSPDTISRIASTTGLEFPPSAAVIGGIAGQDVLNTLGGKEEPVRNFFLFEGATGEGMVHQLGL